MLVVSKELILTIWEVERYYFQIVSVIFSHQPLQRHRVPKYYTIILCTNVLYGLLHVVVRNYLLGPTVFHQFVVAEALIVNYHRIS